MLLNLHWEKPITNQLFENDTDDLVCYNALPVTIEDDSVHYLVISFTGELRKNSGGCLYVNDQYPVPLNGTSCMEITPPCVLQFNLKVPAQSAVFVNSITVETQVEQRFMAKECNKTADVLIVAPDYPSTHNLYLCAFVHSRVREYVKQGLHVQVAAIGGNWYETMYSFEGVSVYNGTPAGLKELLSRKQYKVIVTHFANVPLFQIYDGYITNEKLIFICHGAETTFRRLNNVCRPYFTAPVEHEEVGVDFDIREHYIHKYAQKDNVEWVFVSEWLQHFAEECNHCTFKNCRVICNLIDEKLFPYKEKCEDDRKKIIILRKFDNISVHAIDESVLAILELSRRRFFSDLSFEVYGDGSYWKELTGPIQHFDNVHIHKTFVPNKDMHLIYEKGGILLIPSRHDAHPVAMSEGAASGLVVVASAVTSVPFFMNQAVNHTLAEPENYMQLADIIERLYYNPQEYLEISKRMAKETTSLCCSEQTVMKEIALIRSCLQNFDSAFSLCGKKEAETILSIVVPSYNVEAYLEKCLYSLCNHRNAGKTEILVINDGSKDQTLQIAEDIADKMGGIVRVIDKQNGGHGSTINVGIQEARGKYFRLIDGDDWVDSENLAKQVDILEHETADIVLTKGCYEYSDQSALVNIIDYPMLREDVHYHFDDLLYPYYGFKTYGPLLTTATYRTECLKQAHFHIAEKKPYVDMEFNAYAQYLTDTVVFYDLDIYRYLIGRAGQTVSKEFWERKHADHRFIIFDILRTLDRMVGYSEWRKHEYVYSHLLAMMVDSQVFMYDQLCMWKEIDSLLHELEQWPDARQKALQYIEDKNHDSKFILEHYEAAIRSNRKIPLVGSHGEHDSSGHTRSGLMSVLHYGKKALKAILPYGLIRIYQKKRYNF